MLSKRKFENIVSYGDFTFYGNKKFADQLVVLDEMNLADSSVPQAAINSSSGWINDLTSNIPQSSIVSTTGWIKNSIVNLENTTIDAFDNIYNLFVTKESADNTYATIQDPTFLDQLLLMMKGLQLQIILKKQLLHRRMHPNIIPFIRS